MVGLVARVRIVGVLRSYFIFVLAKIRKSGLIMYVGFSGFS